MAFDAIARRQSAAESIAKSSALVLQFERPVFANNKRTGAVTTVYGLGLLDKSSPSRDRDIENQDIVVSVAALQSDATGVLLATPLDIAIGDHLVWDSKRIPVIRPNAVEPTGITVLYDRLVAGIRKSAA